MEMISLPLVLALLVVAGLAYVAYRALAGPAPEDLPAEGDSAEPQFFKRWEPPSP